MKADMLGMPVTALETVDAGTVGSAMLTGIAVGCFKDLDEKRLMINIWRLIRGTQKCTGRSED